MRLEHGTMQTNLRNNRLPLAIIMLKVTLLIPHKKHHQHRKRLNCQY